MTTYSVSQGSLQAFCKETSSSLILLPLIAVFFGPLGYPSISPLPGCARASKYMSEHAPGLRNCGPLGMQVLACQSMGKKVLLALTPPSNDGTLTSPSPQRYNPGNSLGGNGTALTSPAMPEGDFFATPDQASQFAFTLWNLFANDTGVANTTALAVNASSAGTIPVEPTLLRPLGEDVVVDGFDLGLRPTGLGAGETTTKMALYQVVVDRLKLWAGMDRSKTYYVFLGPHLVS